MPIIQLFISIFCLFITFSQDIPIFINIISFICAILFAIAGSIDYTNDLNKILKKIDKNNKEE